MELPPLPNSLDAAIAQAQSATTAALAQGCTRVQIELALPELKPMPLARQFLSVLEHYGPRLKVFFADAGAAALARREWGATPFAIRGLDELLEPVQPQDQAFLCVAPTPVEVRHIEKMAQAAGDRPFILFNPTLQDVSGVGIGYAGRQLRERFLSTIEICYYLRPLAEGAIQRCYPSPWLVWQEVSPGQYDLIAQESTRPSGDRLEQIFRKAGASTPGFWANVQRFWQALGR